MAFKDMMMKVRRAVLCCGQGNKRPSLEISGPTDVRRGVLHMSGLPKEQKDIVCEKASEDGTRLLSLTSHPPTIPGSPCNSNPTSYFPSPCSSREPSIPLLNSASANLPTTLPTPPRQTHSDSNLPASLPSSAHTRMKDIWERSRRLSNGMIMHSHGGYQGINTQADHRKGGEGDAVVLLNMDFKDVKSKIDLDSPVSTCGKSVEGFVVQDVVGGERKLAELDGIEKAISDIGDSSSDEDDVHPRKKGTKYAETRPLVTA